MPHLLNVTNILLRGVIRDVLSFRAIEIVRTLVEIGINNFKKLQKVKARFLAKSSG